MPDQAQSGSARGARIQARRKALGLTQRQVADAMGVKSTESIRKWESGEQAPDLPRLGAVLEVRPAWLATGEEPMLPAALVDREQLNRIEALLGEILDGLSAPSQPDLAALDAERDRLDQEDRHDEDQDDEGGLGEG
jgi:transcriptional regulator with XRE-family HTH domain